MFKLVISDTVQFPVKLTVNDAGVTKEFSMRLDGHRIDVGDLRHSIEEHGEMKLMDYHAKVCRENLTGWSQQRLVVDAEDNPAPFGPEALECLLKLPGAVGVIHGAYMDAIVASNGIAGRAKN